MKLHNNSKGIALLVVIMIIVTLAMAAAYSMTVGYNQQNVINAAGGKRVVVENAGQTGMVDAMWRLRTGWVGVTQFTTVAPTSVVPLLDATPQTPANPMGFLFDKPANQFYQPTYNMDLNLDGIVDVVVSIGPAGSAGGRRNITATGCGDTRQPPCP